MLGLVSASERSGHRSWEVTRLHVGHGEESHLSELLETVSQEAGASGAERVFMRLRRGDPLADVARRSGFFPRIPEVLYKYTVSPPNRSAGTDSSVEPHDGSLTIRKARASDEHGLFRLYNAATPPEIRYSVGMTLEQWAASQEQCSGRCEEYVLDDGESPKASLKVARKSGTGQLMVVAHPSCEAGLPWIVSSGMERLGKVKTVLCLVPEHQVSLQRTLAERGFSPASDYITLVKSMAAKAKQDARVRATIASAC